MLNIVHKPTLHKTDVSRSTFYHGDCLVEMDKIEDKSVDMILCDLPYGTTSCKWDILIPFEPLWKQYKRILKDNGVILLFGNEPFSSYLRISNIDEYRYDWIWHKSKFGNVFQAKLRPLQKSENISVFTKHPLTYQFTDIVKYYPELQDCNKIVKTSKTSKEKIIETRPNHEYNLKPYLMEKTGYPDTIIKINNEQNKLHPTQKPVELIEFLIKIHTKENDIVLDNTMGSGTTGVACKKTGRHFIGIEKDENYYNIAVRRVSEYCG